MAQSGETRLKGPWFTTLRRSVVAVCLVLALISGVFSGVRYTVWRIDETIWMASQSHDGVRIAPHRPGEPHPDEELVRAARKELRPGETWDLKTPAGGCLGPDGLPPGNNSPRIRYARHSFWLAFRLMPNAMDCTDPDVVLYWRRKPPDPDAIVLRSEWFRIVRP